jgi:hypothetical protein
MERFAPGVNFMLSAACHPDFLLPPLSLCPCAVLLLRCVAGTVSCFIMERFAPGVNFMLSAELDHAAKNYKFGFGFTAGE